jgi:hypothetical protein
MAILITKKIYEEGRKERRGKREKEGRRGVTKKMKGKNLKKRTMCSFNVPNEA